MSRILNRNNAPDKRSLPRSDSIPAPGAQWEKVLDTPLRPVIFFMPLVAERRRK